MTLTNRNRRAEDLVVGAVVPSAGPDVAVDRFLHSLREIVAAEPTPRPSTHLEARLRRGQAVPVVSLATRTAGGRIRRRTRAAVLVAATGVAVLSMLAAAGALPAPAQHASAVLADRLGIHLPDPTPPSRTARFTPSPGRNRPQPSPIPNPNPSPAVTPGPDPTVGVPSVPIPNPTGPTAPASPTLPSLPNLPEPPGTDVTDLLR